MALAQAEMAEISDSMTLSEDSNDLSWVSQNVFPGPHPLVLVRPKKYSVFPEGHFQGHVAGRWLGFPAAARMHAAC